jgi:hypothetical protein
MEREESLPFHKSSLLGPILSQMNSAHVLIAQFLRIILMLPFLLCLFLPIGVSPFRFHYKILYAFLD